MHGILGHEDLVERLRPELALPASRAPLAASHAPAPASRPRVLVIGIYLTDTLSNVADIARELAASSHCEVEQHWIALGTQEPSHALASITRMYLPTLRPKFPVLNQYLSANDLQPYDYALMCDDDIVLPRAFLDAFIAIQSRLEFALAQPARTEDSYYDHPIVERQWGTLARRTRFVEIGPLVSFHRAIFDLVFPFDPASPMGWGYDNVWPRLLESRGLKMGIIDAAPVNHALRKPASAYDWATAERQKCEFLAARDHLSYPECFRVLEAIPL